MTVETSHTFNTFEAFTRSFFQAFGASVEERDGRLYVALSGELAAHYGRDAVTLTFKPHDREGELVAYGSRAFEQMHTFLATRGRLTACALPESEQTAPAPVLVNGAIAPLPDEPAPRQAFILNFHMTFLSDERQERLFQVVLDEAGRDWPEPVGWLEAAEGGEAVAEEPWLPSEVIARAETQALHEAEGLALPLEEEALARLKRAAERLVGYYEEQMADVPLRRRKGQTEDEGLAAWEAERKALRQDLERKLAEETARHQLRVQVRRISLAAIRVPGVVRRHRLETRARNKEISYWENRHTGAAEFPPCERCGHAGPTLGLCREDHLVCDGCLDRCSACDADHCASELSICHVCDGRGCGACLAVCATGHAVCASHLASCSCCGQAYCDACLGECPTCPPGTRVAREHGHPCGTCDAPVCEAHARPCALCAKALCTAHALPCAGCSDLICAAHEATCTHCGISYCSRCRDDGASCRACSIVGDGPTAEPQWLWAVPEPHRFARWTAIENDGYRYLLGHGILGDRLVVTRLDGSLVKLIDLGFWRKLFGGWGG